MSRVLVIGDLHAPVTRKHYLRFCKDQYKKLEEYHGIKLKDKNLTYLRNCVYPPLGLHILNESRRDAYKELFR
ncbi:hypothetical protein LCGC14_2773660 [marine sediment metagenome]|uniref:Uncharacterized protein n=1 Tax=marine sediment metagenome TaxID=412755 RepID=A0A0F9BM09_9ZZZZ